MKRSPKPRHDFSQITVEIQVNRGGTHILWSVQSRDLSVQAKGFAASRLEAMQKATLMVESVARTADFTASGNVVLMSGLGGDDSA